MKHIGQNIRRLRHKSGMSQNQVAQGLKISIPAFSKIETGITDINIQRLNQISELFEVPITDILLEEGSNPQSSNLEEADLLRVKLYQMEQEIIELQKRLIELYEEVREKHRMSV
jgi:transcriptional regulator with XRE-family HTH domain